MRLSLKWLQEFFKEPVDAEGVARDLTMLGIEVENIINISPIMDNIVTARIDEISRHPNADKLSLCKVFDGQDVFDIVCGAKNISEKDIVPLAKIGAQLPNGIKIKKTKIRGETSIGMLCSEVELALGSDKSGIFILAKDAEIGKPLKDILDLNDTVLEISVTPNRGDCLSVKGLVRELYTLKGIPFNTAKFLRGISIPFTAKLDDEYKINIEDKDLCSNYGYSIVKGISIGPSPFNIRYRLNNCGIRPINNIVDITNYVMLELGHPMHAFDLDKLRGKNIIVRKSKKGEKLRSLDGNEHILHDEHLLIADDSGAIAIAGVMGGENTQVTDDTKNILFECASFDPASVRKTSKALNLSSESSYRFERGIDYSDIAESSIKACELLFESSSNKNATFSSIMEEKGNVEKQKNIVLRPVRCERLLGIKITDEKINDILNGLGFLPKNDNKGNFLCTVPPFRTMDVEREIDIIEELARVYGYENINEKEEISNLAYKNPLKAESIRSQIMDVMTFQGFDEVISYCFVSKKESELFTEKMDEVLKLKNPLSEDLGYMRTSLIPSICKIVATNVHYGSQNIKIFEIGKTYHARNNDMHLEKTFLVFAITGILESHNPFADNRPYDFYDLKGVVECLRDDLGLAIEFSESTKAAYLDEQCLQIKLGEEVIGLLSKINNKILSDHYDIDRDVFYCQINIDNIPVFNTFDNKCKPLKRFPSVINDISFLVKNKIEHKDIERSIKLLNIKELENIEIYDIFEGKSIPKGKKSMAYRLRFRSGKRTLKGEEVRLKVEKIISRLKKDFEIELRTL
ncbi:MAG: phenylalanine--tRNA ligase subunit beta [Candidatus Aureabacteria bacterium]|nr:phenylalanine--tRNA ligase subunit beta [Candidatus Auribacterota bacterium]